jgi:hypothetical protein
MSKKKLLGLLLMTVMLHACGEPEETCTCTCTCGSGEKSTIEGTGSEDECTSSCGTHCGADAYSSNYGCTTEGATSAQQAPAAR